ncbi:DUF805 domain-containing protein [Acuticoccus yangtzensis]|uniref:DUF805 domain-containing protein n=1 Tax=Acuticoccus yangtzensis TaxID=1443441 RepID=UPI000949A798|nr:DUF805 domain-containing protein [Acuticoccus yangtzensis]ORE91958.1 hypothetical protein ATO13_18390 [Stappia sp. 22II-S9-Z10]
MFALDGRINREVFWLSNLLCLALTVPLAMAVPIIVVDAETAEIRPGNPAAMFAFAALMWIQVALAVKRLHDRGVTGWASVLLAIPFISLLVFFIIGVVPGEKGPNMYGPGPNQRGRA